MSNKAIKPDMFRVWHDGKMIYQLPTASFLQFSVMPSGDVFFSSEPGYVNGKSRDAKLMLWTGTKDKNKNPVYEDDIVHVSRQLINVGPQYKDAWNYLDVVAKDYPYRKRLLEDGLVQIAEYEEVGIVRRSAVRWSLSPYVAKVVSFDTGKPVEQWVEPAKGRQLRTNRGLWVVEVIGNKYENYDLYEDKQKLT